MQVNYTTSTPKEQAYNSYIQDRNNLSVSKNEHNYEVADMKAGKVYEVRKNMGKVTCTCPAHEWVSWKEKEEKPCKHMIAVWFFSQEQKALREKALEAKVNEIIKEKTTCGFCGERYEMAQMTEEGLCKGCKSLQDEAAKPIKITAKKLNLPEHIQKIIDRW